MFKVDFPFYLFFFFLGHYEQDQILNYNKKINDYHNIIIFYILAFLD